MTSEKFIEFESKEAVKSFEPSFFQVPENGIVSKMGWKEIKKEKEHDGKLHNMERMTSTTTNSTKKL